MTTELTVIFLSTLGVIGLMGSVVCHYIGNLKDEN